MRVVIDLLDWDVTYNELAQWAKDTNASVYAHTDGPYSYEMAEEDFVMFKLTFVQGPSMRVGYKSTRNVDFSMYYSPYIPLRNPEDLVKINSII